MNFLPHSACLRPKSIKLMGVGNRKNTKLLLFTFSISIVRNHFNEKCPRHICVPAYLDDILPLRKQIPQSFIIKANGKFYREQSR